MPSLPENWGLTTKSRPDGKLDIVGKTDAGESYTVRTTDGPGVTDHDIKELRDADRENYSGMSTSQAAKQFVQKIVDHGRKRERDRNESFGDDMIEAAGHVAFGILDRKGCSSPFTGSTRAFRRGWERAFGKEN